MATYKVTKRSDVGSRKVSRLREKGMVPAIVYGHKLEPLAVAMDKHDVDQAVHKGQRVLELDIDGQSQNVLVKEVQYDAMGQDILHIDLARVSLDERVEVTVPVVLRGTPAGAVEGGVLSQFVSDLSIECPVMAIPEDIRVQVAEMKVGDMIKLKDIVLPANVKLLDNPESILCSVQVIAEEVEAVPAEAAAAEPEVIGEKKEEEGEEEAPK